MIYLYSITLVFVLVIGVYLRKRLTLTNREAENAVFDIDCGGIINRVYYTRPLIRLIVFKEEVRIKWPFSMVVVNKKKILSITPCKKYFRLLGVSYSL